MPILTVWKESNVRGLAFIWVPLVLVSSLSAAQSITIRVVDAKNNRSLQKQHVSLSLLYDKDELAPTHYESVLQMETNSNGEAHFTIPEPAPLHVAVRVRLTDEHWRCGCITVAATKDVLHSGMLVGLPDSKSNKATSNIAQKPGEIVFLAHRLTFFERLLYPLLKG
jgi:hypothetical protein